MDHLPLPPGAAELRAMGPALRRLRASSNLMRIWFAEAPYPTGFAHFRAFGPTASRFDHHLAGPDDRPGYGTRAILYAVEVITSPGGHAEALTAAVGEVFQQQRIIDMGTDDPRLALFQTTREVRLLDLTGFWATRIGASSNISSGPREITRSWSGALYDAFPQADGLLYRSSMSGGHCLAVALYERAEDAVAAKPILDLPLGHSSLRGPVERAARRLGYEIMPR
jgi:hypothetical protein